MGQVCIEGDCMPIFKVGDRVKILDKPNWPYEGYKIASWEGTIIRVVEDPKRRHQAGDNRSIKHDPSIGGPVRDT